MKNIIALLGKKMGMIRFFNIQRRNIPVTVIQAGPCFVTQIKNKDIDGYDSVQIAFSLKREKLVTKPLLGHFKKAGVAPQRILKEFRTIDITDSIKLGSELKVDMFSVGDKISISGISKGKGFAGTIKRHGFHCGLKTHGQSDRLRAPGSIGQSSYPSRVFKGMKMAGSMLPIFNFIISRRLNPMAMINRPPVTDIWLTTSGVRNCFMKDAATVMKPWYTKTDIEDNRTPAPRVEAKTTEAIPSSADFAKSV